MHSICPVSLRTPNIIVAIFQLLLFSTLFLSSLPYWSPANVQAVGSPDFSIALSPSFAVYPQDMSQLSSSIILTSENGFNGVIDLNFYWYNGSSDIFISLVNPYLNSGRSVTETVKIFSPPLHSTGCCVILGGTGSSFSHSHSINLTVNVSPIVSGDFELTINPETLVMHPNTSINATMSLRGFDGFSGSVYLSAIEVSQCCPLPTTGDPFAPRAFARPSQIMLGINGFDNSNLTIETPNLPLHGNYTIDVFAQSGSIIPCLQSHSYCSSSPETLHHRIRSYQHHRHIGQLG